MLRRLVKNFRFSVLPVPGRLIAVIFFVLLFTFPLFVNTRYPLLVLMIASIYGIFAVSWDLLSGYTGQINFGHALFFGIGAYGSALLYKYAGWPPVVTILLGAIGAAVIGSALCLPALRLRGPYLSLFTLALPLLLIEVVRGLPDITGGYTGIGGLPRIAGSTTGEYYIILLVMTVSVLIMWKLTDAKSKYVRTGLIFHAIREDEIAARATGIDTIRYKVLAFVIGGFFAGIAGGLFVHVIKGAGLSVFSMVMSFQVIIWSVFGGMVSIYGPLIGVFILYPLVEFVGTTPASDYKYIIMTVMVIAILLFMPQGVAVWIRNKLERECPRCKLNNAAWRRECRACGANLR